MLHERTSWKSKLLVALGLCSFALLAGRSLSENDQLDLFIFRIGSVLALEGIPPYSMPIVQMRAAEAFPPKHADDFALNCGYFLPPQGIAFFVPCAKTTWSGAQSLWFCGLLLGGFCCGLLAWSFGRAEARQGIGWALLIVIVLLNPVTLPSVIVGQTALLFAGCIALGQYSFERGSPRLGCFLWSILFLKPHIALPFLVLAWILGGWRRAAGIAFFVAIWNLLGGLILTGTFEGAYELFRAYITYVGAAHKVVKYNLVAANFQILSWNRIIAALGGQALDLTIGMTLAGFAVWAGLVFARVRIALAHAPRGQHLDPAYLLAATVVGSLFFAQVIAYELILLILLAPLILQHFDSGRRGDAWFLIAFLGFLMIPMNLMDQLADRLNYAELSRQRTLLRSHRCFGMGVLALFILVRGPGHTVLEAPRRRVDPNEVLE